MKLGIVIPFFNKWELTHKLLMSLYQHIPEWCEIYLVNDASTEDVSGGVAWWQKQVAKHKIFYIVNDKNIGFGGSMNKGAKAAIKQGCDAIVLLSNDVLVFNDFATVVKNQLEENPLILIGGEVLYNDTGWNVLPECVTVPYANGWFLACTSKAWRDIGGFDLLFGLFDYEDIDISLQAWIKGYVPTPINPPAKLQHLGGKTIYAYYSDRMSRTLENKKLFIEKWSGRCDEIREKIYGKSN